LRHKAQVCGVNPEGQSALSLAKSLYSVGEITKRDCEELSGALRTRNALMHGFRVGRGIRTSVQRLTTMAKELLSGSETE